MFIHFYRDFSNLFRQHDCRNLTTIFTTLFRQHGWRTLIVIFIISTLTHKIATFFFISNSRIEKNLNSLAGDSLILALQKLDKLKRSLTKDFPKLGIAKVNVGVEA